MLGDDQYNVLSHTNQIGTCLCRHQEHEQQVQQLQQQLQLAQQEHRNLQARLEASKQAAAAREAEAAAAAAAAATAEQAAKRAAAEAKKQRLAAAASAALAGAQPQRSCPGFQPLQLPQQLQPVQQQQPLHQQQQKLLHQQQQQQQLLQQDQQVMHEREGQQALDRATRRPGSPLSPPFSVPPQRFAGPGASGALVSPGYYSLPSPSYAACVQDMQQQVHALKGSLDRQTDRHKHQRQHRTDRNSKHAARSRRLYTHNQDDGASPVRPKHHRAVLEDLFDAEAHSGAESEHEASDSGGECSSSSSDRCCCTAVFCRLCETAVH